MKELIDELEQITDEFMEVSDDLSYERAVEFVDKRQRVIDSISVELNKVNITKEDKIRVNNLLKYDKIILDSLERLKLEARDWLQQRSRIKAQHSAYDHPYSPGSILMDRRK
ncbi:hypothetical protein ACFSVM_22385 [Paenibacillus shunpengii]|uniref:Flagellar protein FliT n=1 Tax=Paenibacillus shunpengii TaxID=2054424 RepID=A0ABW5SVE0_9BACL